MYHRHREDFMNWVLILLAAVAVGTVFGVGMGNHRKANVAFQLVKNRREDIRRLLERVELEEAPAYVPGAMCYGPMAHPERAEYICPVCGERTLYGSPEAWFLQNDIHNMRRMAEGLSETGYFEAFLEETFCSFCNPGVQGSVRLVIVYEEGDTVKTVVNLQDLSMIQGLLRGGLVFPGGTDDLLPLKDRVDRLRTILGIE